MVSDLVTGRHDPRSEVLVAAHPVGDEKERRPGIMASQHVQQPRRRAGVRSVVDGQGDERRPCVDEEQDTWRATRQFGHQPAWLIQNQHQSAENGHRRDRQQNRRDLLEAR